MRKIARLIMGLILLIVIAVGGYGYYLYDSTLKPVDSQDETVMNYKIEPGTTTKRVNQQLAELGLIKHPKMADLIVRLNDWSHIQAGEYALSPSLTLEEMYQKFEAGDVTEPDMVKVTIPEGYDLEYIAAVMSPLVGLTAEDLLMEWKNPSYVRTLIDEYWFLTEDVLQEGIKYPLEGYIYPITYAFVDDIYMLADCLLSQDDITLIERKDYIKNPKENGYRSLHLVVEVPIFLQNEKRLMRVEVQLRTIAMEFWANLEHRLRYKKDLPQDICELTSSELSQCAEMSAQLDLKMQNVRNIIENG